MTKSEAKLLAALLVSWVSSLDEEISTLDNLLDGERERVILHRVKEGVNLPIIHSISDPTYFEEYEELGDLLILKPLRKIQNQLEEFANNLEGE